MRIIITFKDNINCATSTFLGQKIMLALTFLFQRNLIRKFLFRFLFPLAYISQFLYTFVLEKRRTAERLFFCAFMPKNSSEVVKNSWLEKIFCCLGIFSCCRIVKIRSGKAEICSGMALILPHLYFLSVGRVKFSLFLFTRKLLGWLSMG